MFERLNHMKKTLLALVVCAIAAAQQNPKPNLSGSWQIDYHDDNGVSTSQPQLFLQQTGDKLTGTFGSFNWPIVGAIDGNHVVFTFVAFGNDRIEGPISDTVFYWGTIDGTSKMGGRMKNPKEAGNWTAIRK
jgi:hypothetical protein